MTDANSQDRRQAARGYVASAFARLQRQKAEPRAVIVDVANAIDMLCYAHVRHANLRALTPEYSEPINAALFDLAPALAEAVGNEISLEDLYFLLGMAAALVTASADEYHPDRLNYAAILSARLKISLHRQLLEGRGYPLARAIHQNRLMSTPRLPTDPIH